MASRSSVVFCLVLLVASCLVKIEEAASTNAGALAMGALMARKLFSRGDTTESGNGIKEETNEEVGKSGKLLQEEEADDDIMNGKSKLEVGWELRKVPSGPDPLHHNGNAPKKPRTDPLKISVFPSTGRARAS